MGEGWNPVIATEISIDVPKDKEDGVWEMLKKPERAWFGELGDINITEMRIDMVSDAKSFKYELYSAGQRPAT